MSAESDADTSSDTDTPVEAETETGTETSDEQTPDLTTEAGGFACRGDIDTVLNFFEQFTPILDEMTVHLNPDGLEGSGVDPANVGMVKEELPEAAFDHYSSTGGVIGLDLGRITDILGLGDSGDLVSMELDQETRKLEIEIISQEKGQ